MKRIFEYTGIVVLVLFSFYYTDKVSDISLKTKMVNTYNECDKGYMINDDVVLDSGYNCDLNLTSVYNKYIIKGNASLLSVSLIIQVDNALYIDDIYKILNKNNIKADYMISLSKYEKNKNIIDKLINEETTFLYIDKDDSISKYKKIFNNVMCYKEGDIINKCEKAKINTIRSDKVYDISYYINVKNNLEIGDFIVLKESKELVEELPLIIKYIKAKGLNIVTLKRHL